MKKLLNRKQSRREFISGFGRYLMLGGIISAAGTLLVRRKSAQGTDASVDVSACQKCAFFRRCDQPDAVLARKEITG